MASLTEIQIVPVPTWWKLTRRASRAFLATAERWIRHRSITALTIKSRATRLVASAADPKRRSSDDIRTLPRGIDLIERTTHFEALTALLRQP